MNTTTLAEHRYLPDRLVRFGIRRLLADRLRGLRTSGPSVAEFAKVLRAESSVAIDVEAANAQHYEVPAPFFQAVLGQRLKYSCGYWPESTTTLDESEIAMLRLTCDRAGLVDGQRILELGCGWGSLSLWMAENYSNSQITAMSNSESQREFIEQQAAIRGLTNLQVHTANIADFATSDTYDRIISVEMFEHVRNYEVLLRRIREWLTNDGQLFVHVFCHRKFAYPFEVDSQSESDAGNWMSQHFFTGGIMPSFDLFRHFDDDMQVVADWWHDGTHYARTSQAWLEKLDCHRQQVCRALQMGDNPASVNLQVQRWRMFFMACAELFAYDNGHQWGVGHYLLQPRVAK